MWIFLQFSLIDESILRIGIKLSDQLNKMFEDTDTDSYKEKALAISAKKKGD